jgi:hypothetical protein
MLTTGISIIMGVSSVTPSARAALSTTDAAAAAEIKQVTTSWSVTVDDFDGDGLSDVLLGRHRHAARLYRNEGGSFTMIDAGNFRARDRHDCATADVDQDGRVDIFCTIGANGGRSVRKKNELWIQQPDGTFIDRAEDFGVTDPFGRGRRTAFLDVNHDAYPDLFIGNTYPRKDKHRSPNRLFLNQTGSAFTEDRGSGLTRELGARCVQVLDFDSDGWDDLVICGKTGRPLKLFRNSHTDGFIDVTHSMGVRGQAAGAQLADINGDGRLDLIRIGTHSLRVQLGGAAHIRRASFIRPLANGVWFALGDANGDGRIDVYAVQGCVGRRNRPDVMLINRRSTGLVPVPVPEAHEGCGGYASPIDFDSDGKTDFVVVNGQGRWRVGSPVVGPVQLITFGDVG